MKRVISSWMILLSVSFSFPVLAQNEPVDKHIIKFHLTPLLLHNVGVQYEHMLGPRVSMTLNGRWMPQGNLPMQNALEPFLGDWLSLVNSDNLTVGGYALWPEFRFYLGRKDGPTGFYLAPYASFSHYSAALNQYEFSFVDMDNQTQHVSVDLDMVTRNLTAGVTMGVQWRLGKRVYLDWWFLGASYGKAAGDLDAISSRPLAPDWQEAIKEEIEGFNLRHLKIDGEVHEYGARAKLTGPWAGLKSGLSLGLKF